MAKIIKDFKLDLSSIAAGGATRRFTVIGDDGAIFSLEVKNEDGYYYNFRTNTFAAAYKRLKSRRVDSGAYTGSITFPTVGDDDQYDIYLYAEHGTVHAKYSEVRFGDGSLDINSSVGSNSSLLQKVIYQYDDVTITLAAISPDSTYRSTGNFHGMSVTADTIVVGRGTSTGKTAFTVVATVAVTKAVQIKRQPVASDISAATSITMDSGVQIPGEDIWGGTARATESVVNGEVSGESVTMDDDVGSGTSANWAIGDRVTGNAALDAKTGVNVVTITAINVGSNAKVFTMSEAVAIDDDETLTFTPPFYYRWNINSSSSIHKLLPGMRMFTADSDIDRTTENTVSNYEATTTYTTEVTDKDGSVEEVEHIVTNVSVPALDPLGFKPTITNGLVTQQLGYITFNNQIQNDLDGIGAKFIAYGTGAIKAIHDTEIKLTDLKVALIAPTTTTTEATSVHATIAVTDREGVVNNVSTVDGIGIDISAVRNTDTVDGVVSGATKIIMDNNVADKMKIGDRVTGTGIPSSSVVTVTVLNPDGDNVKEFSVSEPVSINDGVTLTFTPYALPTITSGGGADGAGDWVMSTVQSLENGITLTVGGTSRTAIITGNIEFVNVDDTDFTLSFDLEKFLTAS